MMESFFDTSALVPVFVGTDPRHTVSFEAFEAASKDKSACAAHTLAEVYSVLTRLPVKPPISTQSASEFIREICGRLTIVSLTPNDYHDTIQQCAKLGIAGGRLYDALLLCCAEKCEPDVIYTWNVKHFQALSPHLASRIRTP